MDRNKGTGLGLPITRQFIELMGGTIGIDSVLGKGSLFRVTVPIFEAKKAQIQQIEINHGRIIGLRAGQPVYRILIVEDQLENRLLLKKLLQPLAFEIREAVNGHDAVKLFQHWQPHLIWMDRRMPVMDGIEATRCIKAMPGGKQTVIIALTASAFRNQRELLLQAGSDDFISKPYRAEEIFACLTKHLGVRYVYEGETNTVKHPRSQILQPKPEDLQALPKSLQNALYSAATQLDIEQTLSLIDQITVLDKKLAAALRQSIENMDFQAIIHLFECIDA